MVVVFLDNSDRFGAMVCRQMAQAYTHRNVKIHAKFFSQKHQKVPIFIATFQRPVIKASATEIRGPDTSADAYV